MKVGQDAAKPRSMTTRALSPAVTPAPTDWTASEIVSDVLKRLGDDDTRYIARAPGRLDVMGGSAEYTGSLVLNTTVADHVCAAVQRRADGRVSIATSRPDDSSDGKAIVLDVTRLSDGQGGRLSPEGGRSLLHGSNTALTHGALGALVAFFAAHGASDRAAGLSLVVGATSDEVADLGQEAALGAAVVTAAARAMDVELGPVDAAKVLHGIEPGWFSVPIAMTDVVAVLAAEANALTQVRCDPCALLGSIRLPADLALVGIDSGAMHPEAKTKYEQVRTSVFMGRTLIDRIIRHDGASRLQWDGYLSRISVTDYVERFRDRIPTKIKGREFLDRFGETGDPLTRIDPVVVYKVRSRTEHHIYEHNRAHQFAECLSRAIRSGDAGALRKAGELMYSSHWSYGQRCGLGNIETDLLVNLLRHSDAKSDIYGAKITGCGCGGVVAVLMRTSDRATAAVDQAIEDYQTRAERKARLICGSLPGALVSGVREM
jgi:galactokinase